MAFPFHVSRKKHVDVIPAIRRRAIFTSNVAILRQPSPRYIYRSYHFPRQLTYHCAPTMSSPADSTDFPSASGSRTPLSTQQNPVNGSTQKPQDSSAVDYLSRRLEIPDSEWFCWSTGGEECLLAVAMPHRASREETVPMKDD